MNVALAIAGFDTSSGAGMTADLMVFAAHGLYGTACITALTVQSTTGVHSVEPIAPKILSDSLGCVTSDIPSNGIKIGMLDTIGNVEAVAAFLGQMVDRQHIPIVLDPVLRSSSGYPLLEAEGVVALGRLLPLVSWITPNIEELAILSGQEIAGAEGVPAAAEALQRRFPNLNVVVTGGHLDSPDDFLLTVEGKPHWFSGERIESTSTHGTGCAFSSALLCRLILGDGPVEAVAAAKAYVAEAIRSAPGIGRGRGPLDHLWTLRRR